MKRFLVAVILAFACAIARGTVTSQVDKTGPFTFTSGPQTIATGFPFQASADLLVLDMGSSATPRDPAVVLALGSDYTVTGGGYNSANAMQVGSIVVSSTGIHLVIANDLLVIMRNVLVNQTSSFTSTGPLTISLLEQALDKQATLSQQVNEVAQRNLRVEKNEFLDGTMIKTSRAGNFLAFDANGAINFIAPAVASVPTDISSDLVKATNSSTLRSLAKRASDIINVKDYGATGDGATDDAASVLAAAQRASTNGGGCVYFPAGNYMMNATYFDNLTNDVSG